MDRLSVMTLMFPSTELLKLHFYFLGFEKVNGLFRFSFEKGKYAVIDFSNSHSE